MTDLNTPNSFVSGTTIVAADVNENFQEIEDFLNTTGVPVLQDGAVDTSSRIADGIVTHSKMGDKTLGQQVSSGFSKVTSAIGPTTGPATVASITVSGDGATPMKIEGRMNMTVGTTGFASILLKEGSDFFASIQTDLSSGDDFGAQLSEVLPAFSGSKTIYLQMSGAGSITSMASSTSPITLRATWAPGYSTS